MTAKIYHATQTTKTRILLGGQAVEMRIPEKPIALKGWFIKKEFGRPIHADILGIINETEKAMQVVIFGIGAHDEDDRSVLWVPKACVEEVEA